MTGSVCFYCPDHVSRHERAGRLDRLVVHDVTPLVCFQKRFRLVSKLISVIMQHDLPRTSPIFFFCDESPSMVPGVEETPPLNFAEALPTEMSVKIFGELDTASLCSASLTCRLWRDIIEDSEQLWRQQCLLVRAVCQREVDKDRRNGLSWKVTLVRNYTLSCVKLDWLTGRYSKVRSADELRDRIMVPLDAESWGEILQAELDR